MEVMPEVLVSPFGVIPKSEPGKWKYGDTCKHADFKRANDMICDLDLDEIFVENDIQASWSN